MKVKFYTAAGLINEMAAAQQEYKLNRLKSSFYPLSSGGDR
jgi:hypothetical protein